MTKTSPTQRSLAHLRAAGYVCDITEHWNAYTHRRKDLFGVLDLVALGNGELLGVQTTSGSNLAARVTKILAEPRARRWLLAGGKIVVHGWAKRGPRGKRKVWALREQTVTLIDFGEDPEGL